MKIPPTKAPNTKRSGFTLVEVLLSTAILGLLVALFATLVAQTSNLWQRTTGKIEQFREARNAFDSMTARLSQATLNTYWDYNNPTAPTKYERRSELRFISGPADKVMPGVKAKVTRLTHSVFFMAPLGFTTTSTYQTYNNLLCACGYYLEYGSDEEFRPAFITSKIVPPRYRHRLVEFMPPTENTTNAIYKYTSGSVAANNLNTKNWYLPLANATAAANTVPDYHPLAENIVALIITPRLSAEDEKDLNGGTITDESKIAPDYFYDTTPGAGTGPQYSNPLLNPTNQLPPILQVTMVAIDERSAVRLGFDSASADVFKVSKKFTRSADYSTDLLQSADSSSSLEATLISNKVNYRIFNTNVAIRGAKWSRAQ